MADGGGLAALHTWAEYNVDALLDFAKALSTGRAFSLNGGEQGAARGTQSDNTLLCKRGGGSRVLTGLAWM
ncbi:hypothetical protein OPT61_g7753 [Boeremia exigua]|uniref:Uncharacterized protein n=1 Tax=Boeremia exigua TaxID=749465 RepID=A0ACC2I136_9PLEO|nr:hypothetical protein OPT61_g7753 [Boeremia exigua]